MHSPMAPPGNTVGHSPCTADLACIYLTATFSNQERVSMYRGLCSGKRSVQGSLCGVGARTPCAVAVLQLLYPMPLTHALRHASNSAACP